MKLMAYVFSPDLRSFNLSSGSGGVYAPGTETRACFWAQKVTDEWKGFELNFTSGLELL